AGVTAAVTGEYPLGRILGRLALPGPCLEPGVDPVGGQDEGGTGGDGKRGRAQRRHLVADDTAPGRQRLFAGTGGRHQKSLYVPNTGPGDCRLVEIEYGEAHDGAARAEQRRVAALEKVFEPPFGSLRHRGESPLGSLAGSGSVTEPVDHRRQQPAFPLLDQVTVAGLRLPCPGL